MPCIWGRHNGSQVFCALSVLPPQPAPGLGGAPEGAPYVGPSALVNALVDTGATTTGITSRLAAQLQLQPVGKVPIQGVGGVQHHNSYLFMVAFPFLLPPGSPLAAGLPPPAPGQVQTQIHVLDKVIQGCEFHGGSANFQIIMGMDILSTGSLVIQGDGSFSFSF